MLERAQHSIKVDVKLVRLLVSVKDARGELVGSLEKPDFTVYDSGVKQESPCSSTIPRCPFRCPCWSTPADRPPRICATDDFGRETFCERWCAKEITGDAAALYAFNDEVTRMNSFTRREQRLIDSLKDLKGKAGTSLYDAVYLASRDLSRRDGRHVIVAVTDGGDTTSIKKYRRRVRSRAERRRDHVSHSGDPHHQRCRAQSGRRARPGNAGERHRRPVFQPMGARRIGQSVRRKSCAICGRSIWSRYYPHNLPQDAPQFHSCESRFPARICGPRRAPDTMGMRQHPGRAGR